MPSLQSQTLEQPEAQVYPPFKSKTAMIQVGYGIWVNLTMVSLGLSIGFSAVAVPHFEDSTKIKLTVSEGSWLTSVINLVQPAGCILAGVLTDKFGRRVVLIIGQVPAALGWFVIGLATTPMQAIFGRVLSGFGTGMAMGPPRTYVTEVTLPNMRAVIGAFSNLAISIGISVQAIIASQFEWRAICFICGCYNIALTIGNCFLPESPYYILMKEEDSTRARGSLQKFRAKNYQIDKEMAGLIKFKESHRIRRLSFTDRVRVVFSPTACKPFIITMVYFNFGQLSGIGVTTFWTIKILQESKSSVEPYTGNVLLAVTRLTGGLVVIGLLYRVGKRKLALASSIGSAVSYLILGIYLKYAEAPTVYPQLLFMTFLFFASLGYLTLPFIIAYELVPLQIRGLMGGLAVSLACFQIFAATKLYPYLRQYISLADTILICSINSMLATVFLYMFLPETYHRNLHELENFYSNRSMIMAPPCLVKHRQRHLEAGAKKSTD